MNPPVPIDHSTPKQPEPTSPGGDARPERVPGSPRLSQPLSQVAQEPLWWLVVGFVAFRSLTDLSGAPGLGKSLLTHWLAALLSRGVELPGHLGPPRPMATVIIGAEDDPGEVRRRLDGMGADPARIHLLSDTAEGKPITLTKDYDAIAAEVILLAAGLVVIDNAAATLGTGLSSHRGAITGMGLARNLAQDTGAAVITIRHHAKRPTGSAVNAGIGSIGSTATARTATVVAADPDDPARIVWAVAKSNAAAIPPSLAFRITTGPTGAAAINFDGLAAWSADEILRTTPSASATKTDHALDLLEDLLRHGSRSRAEIESHAAHAGIGWRTVESAKAQLGVESRQFPVPGKPGPGPSHWRLPDTPWHLPSPTHTNGDNP